MEVDQYNEYSPADKNVENLIEKTYEESSDSEEEEPDRKSDTMFVNKADTKSDSEE